jgi:hypothetical protein
MADLERIKNNVAKMVAMNAPENDIDGYIASEGVTIDDVKNYQPTSSNVLGAVAEVDKGGTGGFGRKLGALLNAVGASPVDALLTDKSLGEAFSDRYNEIVDPALKASEKFEGANPKTALALNIAGAVASPFNKVGGNFIMKGAGTANKLMRSGAVGAGSGAVYGAGRTENLEDLGANIAEDAQMGGALGVVAPLAIQGVKNTVSKLRPQNSLANKATGLNNIAKDTESMKLLKRGIQADDAIANQVKEEAPAALNNLNEKMRESLNRLTGRKLDIAQANVNQQNRYNEFIGKNADDELLNFAPTREQLNAIKPQSKFNPNKKLTREEADALLRDRAALQKLGIYNDGASYLPDSVDKGLGIQHMLGDDRKAFVRTLNNTMDNPDLKFSQNGKDYFVKKYTDSNTGKDFYDFAFKQEDKLFNKYPKEKPNGIVNQINEKTTKNLSFGGDVSQATGRGTNPLTGETINSIPNQNVVVNNNLPRLSAYTEGLDAFQKDALEQALNKGAYMSTNAKGTLGATHRGQEVLNDMIEASYDTSIIGQKKPTTKTRQLMQVKEILNQILEPSGVKPYDASLSKAKALQDNFEKGYRFNPSETKFEALGLSKARDKRAFLQGRIANILDNVKDDKNIAKAIQSDENTLRKLMSDANYKKLLKDANSISTEYERIKNLSLQAEKQLVKPDAVGRPFSERAETRGAMLGSLIDKLNQIVMTDSNRKAANILLGNEKAINSRLFNAFGKIPDYSATPYLVDILSQNK